MAARIRRACPARATRSRIAALALLTVLAVPATPAASAAEPELTATEQRWLAGATPVVAWALHQGLPVEVLVLPQARAGDAPLALGYTEDHRCQLVFAMRGNPAAERTLEGVPAHLQQAVLEAMTAHEIAHCWRHRDGAFSSLPAGFSDAPDAIEARQPTAELAAIAREMRVTRREEAFADLVGLAWTHRHHADSFAEVLGWFDQARADETEHGFHDTRHWLNLAHEPQAFASPEGPFDQAMSLWRRGLGDD
jgi:hypothetical protein